MARQTKTGTNASDTLNGLTGLFNLFGKGGNDVYLIDQTSDAVFETANSGIDTIRTYGVRSYVLPSHVEDLIVWFTTATSTFRGNSLDNVMDARQFGSGFDNETRLYGEGGADTLIGGAPDDWLDGGTGADTMRGGKGDDTYFVDNASDRIYEVDSHPTANESKDDLILSAITLVLPNEVEHLTLTGSANTRATGNAMSNELRGNSGNNLIEGKLGYDAMYGGGGADRFVYRSIADSGTKADSGYADEIKDFSSGAGDRIDLRLIDADPTLSGDQAFKLHTGLFDAAGQVRFKLLSNATAVELNTDSDEAPEMVIRVVNGGAGSASWFLL